MDYNQNKEGITDMVSDNKAKPEANNISEAVSDDEAPEALYTESYEKPIDPKTMYGNERPFAYLDKDPLDMKSDREYDRERAQFLKSIKTANGLNIASTIIGGVSIMLFITTICISVLSIFVIMVNIVGLVLGIIGLAKHGNKGTGFTGVIINSIVAILSVIFGLTTTIFWASIF